LIAANGFEAFAAAFRQKLVLEIAGPAPSPAAPSLTLPRKRETEG